MKANNANKAFRISVADDFSKHPCGITKDDSPNCAENFRNNILIPALKKYGFVHLNLDATFGFSSAWLKEVFSKLVIDNVCSAQELHKKLTLFSFEDESLVKESWSYIDEV